MDVGWTLFNGCVKGRFPTSGSQSSSAASGKKWNGVNGLHLISSQGHIAKSLLSLAHKWISEGGPTNYQSDICFCTGYRKIGSIFESHVTHR